jgi:hypothetical protein
VTVSLASNPKMSKPQYLLAGSGSAIAVAIADYVIGWEVTPNPLYFVPIGLFAWCTNRKIALGVALFASLAFAMVEGIGAHAATSTTGRLSAILVQSAGCVGVALLADGVRRLIGTCRRAQSPVDIEDDSARARAQMRRLNPDGTPRSSNSMNEGH